MKQRFLYLSLLAILAVVTFSSCSDEDKFSVTLSISDLGAQSVSMVYFADGKVNEIVEQPSSDGTVKFEGSATDPAIIDFSLTSSSRHLITLVAQNGENIKCEFTLKDPLNATVKGSIASEEYLQFLKENRSLLKNHDARINTKIADYIKSHRDNLSSTALLVTHFEVEGYETLADSLLNIISPSARPSGIIENFNAVVEMRARKDFRQSVRNMTLRGASDSIYIYAPRESKYTLFLFSGEDISRHDSIYRQLADISSSYSSDTLRVVEISLLPDSADWRRTVKGDTVEWDRAWAAGAAAGTQIRNLHISRTPYFIFSDSIGRQIYRTPYVSNARITLSEHIKNNK